MVRICKRMLTRAKRKRVEGQLWSYSTIDPRTKRRRKCIFSCSLLEPALDQGREGTCIHHSYTRAMYYRAKLNECLQTRKCWSREHVVSTARHNIPKNQKGRALLIMQQIFEKTNEQGISLSGNNGAVKATNASFINRCEESNKADVDRKLLIELEENGPFVIRFAMQEHFNQRASEESRGFVYVANELRYGDRKAGSHCVVVTGHGVREGDGLPFWEYQNSHGSLFRNVSALPEEKGLGLGRVAKDSVLTAVVPHECRVSGGGESSLGQQEVSSHGGEETGI